MIAAITTDIRVVRYEAMAVHEPPSQWYTLLRLDASSPRLLVDDASFRPQSYTIFFLSRFRHWQLESTGAEKSPPVLAVQFTEEVFPRPPAAGHDAGQSKSPAGWSTAFGSPGSTDPGATRPNHGDD